MYKSYEGLGWYGSKRFMDFIRTFPKPVVRVPRGISWCSSGDRVYREINVYWEMEGYII